MILKILARNLNLYFVALPDVSISVVNDMLVEGDTLVAECVSSNANPPVSQFSWRLGEFNLDTNNSKISIPNIKSSHHNAVLSCSAGNTVGNKTAAEILQIKCKLKVNTTFLNFVNRPRGGENRNMFIGGF